MLLVTGAAMPAGRGGRPKKTDGGQGTKHVRVFADVAEMIAWITRIKGNNSAQLLDPIIRSSIVSQYKILEREIEAIKRAEAAARAKHLKTGGQEPDSK